MKMNGGQLIHYPPAVICRVLMMKSSLFLYTGSDNVHYLLLEGFDLLNIHIS